MIAMGPLVTAAALAFAASLAAPGAAPVPLARLRVTSGELRETTMDPVKRLLKRVTLEDAVLAGRVVNELMGRENAEARRALLTKQAKHLALTGALDV